MNRARLADVLRVRRLQERAAAGALARANEHERTERETESRLWASLEHIGAAHLGAASMGASRLDAMVATRRAGLLAADSQRERTADAHEAAAEAHHEWAASARDVEALERLEERLAEEAAVEEERAQRVELDDLVLARRTIAANRDGGDRTLSDSSGQRRTMGPR